MSRAYSRILEAPEPADSGTTLRVLEDDGHKFPPTPFTAIVWPVEQNPTPANSEEMTVTAIEGDVLTVTRADLPIEIEGGLLIGVKRTMATYSIGQPIVLSHDFTAADEPYTVSIHTPQGELGAYGSATGVTDDGEGTAYFAFTPHLGGLWRARFSSVSLQGPETLFHVKHSDTLS